MPPPRQIGANDWGVGRGDRVRKTGPGRAAAESPTAAYLRGAGSVRQELDLLRDRLDELVEIIDQSVDLTAAQRARLSAMLLRVRTGYRGPLEP